MPQTRHSSKFSCHVSCPDFLDRVSVLFTASVAPCSCFSTTTKGDGERINQSSEPAPTESFFSRQGAGQSGPHAQSNGAISWTTANIHLRVFFSNSCSLIVSAVLWGPTKVSQRPNAK
ncbi:uncharacterized [Tachysurus ichikawai]